MKFQVSAIALGCIALLSGCGGGGGGSSDGGKSQSITFNFPGGGVIGIPPNVTTTKLVAIASGGGPVTFTTETPTCTVSGDTLSLVKAGECIVTAHQAGGNGYAAASQSQLFVIPKNIQTVAKFQNPGWQPVGGAPVQLAATVDTGLPVTFSSKTPTICSVSGTTMTPLANGMCTVTATQAGNDTYATLTADKNIPIGTELPPKLTFLDTYNDDPNTTGGGVGHAGGFWWCFDCAHTVSSDKTSLTFSAVYKDNPPAAWQYDHGSFKLYGPNIMATDLWFPTNSPTNEKNGTYRDGVSASAFTPPLATPKGAQVDIQGNLHFNLAQNPDWFNSADNSVNVEIFLAHFNTNKLDSNGNACYVSLKATVKPTAAAATDYSVGLKDKFALNQTCDLTDLDLWTELQTYPVIEIKFSPVRPQGETGTMSNDVPPKTQYVSAMTLTGPIYFQ